MTADTDSPWQRYTVSAELLARDDMAAALRGRDFGAAFLLMRKWDHVSQDRIASSVEGFSQSRVSRIAGGKARVEDVEVIERIADGLRIPGAMVGLAPRPWETSGATGAAPHPPREILRAPTHRREQAGAAFVAPPATSPPERSAITSSAGESAVPGPSAGDVEDRSLTIDIDVAEDGWATLTYWHELHNRTATPFTRLNRELWFETTNGPLQIEALPSADRNIIIQRIHDTKLNARFACQIFPAVQPGESAMVGYRSTGGRFVQDHYWRQSIVRPTGILTIRLRHQGVTSLTRCSATEDRPDGSEISAAEGLSFARDDSGVVIELTRRNLRPNQFVTLRWDTAHAST